MRYLKVVSIKPAEAKSGSIGKLRDKMFFRSGVKVIRAKDGKCIIDLRTYHNKSLTNNSSIVWIHDGNIYASGVETCGGWGYDREKQSAIYALSNAGVEFNTSCLYSPDQLVEVLAKRICKSKFYVVRMEG